MNEKVFRTPHDIGITSESIKALSDIGFFDVRTTPEFRIYGVMDSKDGYFCRIPEDVAAKTNPGLAGENLSSAGGRVRFVTDSDYIALKTYVSYGSRTVNISYSGAGSYDVYVKMGGKETFVRGFCPPVPPTSNGYEGLLTLPKGMKEVTLYLPNYCKTKDFYIGLDKNATLSRHPDYKIEKPIIYCGSSITQGGCASRSGLSYEAIIARRLDANFTNLGFSGSFRAEDELIDYIATLDASVMVFDYDHNAPSPEHLDKTHERLYLAYREKHPDTPVIFIGKPDFYLDRLDSAKRRKVISKTYENARLRGERVYFIDGYSLFAGDMREDCTVDGIHPNDIGMKRMADVIGEIVALALREAAE